MNIRPVNDSNNNNGFICGVVEGFYGKPWTFEQRKDLFEKLKEFKLNAFMYAPKDDTKHRAKWRQLYSDQEARELKSLIDEARAKGIDFYYSLAPGLDMVYSDREELNLLIKKYDQLVGLGCESFAILFDDIEPSIDDRDKNVFKNYAMAQVSVTNMIYEHLNKPKFLFCPTEYCESRAVPNVQNSNYLSTLGTGLHANIDIMWSGSRVISRLITEESIERLTEVIRRPPVIWENLHANDYDKKRVFLGPYSGRSTKIIPKLRGVLTNPNCEYEANYIAIHTLAQWSKSTGDINQHNRCNLELQQQQLQQQRQSDSRFNEVVMSSSTEADSQTEQPQTEFNSEPIYDPHSALMNAIRDWLPHILKSKPLPNGIDLTAQLRLRSDDTAACQQLLNDVEGNSSSSNIYNNQVIDMSPDETQSSATSVSTNKSDMDTSDSPALQSTSMNTGAIPNPIESNSCDSCEMQDDSKMQKPDTTSGQQAIDADDNDKINIDCIMCSTVAGDTTIRANSCSFPPVDLSTSSNDISILNCESLALLVDLFYLPFEHGLYGNTLLRDIRWLKENHDSIIGSASLVQRSGSCSVAQSESGQSDKFSDEMEAKSCGQNSNLTIWMERAERLNNLCACISRLVNSLIYHCPNKLLIIELYPYLADLRDVSSMIMDYIKFLRYRNSTLDRFYGSPKQKELSCNDEQEPWIHRGGLVGDVQRLLS